MYKENITPLPVGESDFEALIKSGSYYVDKTLFIKDILDRNAKCLLCTRPRRFGKTLNQMMLKYFFEDTTETGGKDTRSLFNGLNIERAGEKYLEHQGRYPVIFLSFKGIELDTYEDLYDQLKFVITEEFKRHRYIRSKITDKEELELFNRIVSEEGTLSDYSASLKYLSKLLVKYYGKKVIVLIDEYDVPLNAAHNNGFFRKLVEFVSPLLSGVLKDNTHLLFGVVTGCLRISKESIFTGLNNLDVISILNKSYSEYFGFTQVEMDAMLAHYGMESKAQAVREWYDGYLFGNTEVYNPWSSILVVRSWITDIEESPKPYWANTSGNDIVRKLIDIVGGEAKAELETLMAGGTISKVIHEDITYAEIENDADNIWNFLFFTGYLKKVSETTDSIGRIVVEMKIPNRELEIVFVDKIDKWFQNRIRQKDFQPLYDAILNGNAESVQKELNDLLLDTISYFDGMEDFYHGFMLGILTPIQGGRYWMDSNIESGTGRSDIILKHASGRGKAIVLELKRTKEMSNICKESEDALKQIDKNQYTRKLEKECYTDIIKYGIAFCKKSCEVRKG
jgi:hypothetical protein